MTTALPTTSSETVGPFVRTVFPSGAEVFFRESDHSYWREANQKRERGHLRWAGSGRLTGVSSLCKPFDFYPDSLMKWAAELDHEGIARVFGGRELPKDPAEIRSALWANRCAWQQARDEKADAGTNAHMMVLHKLAVEDEVPDLGALPPKHQGFGRAVFAWWHDRKPTVLHAEQTVVSLEHGVAGTLDLRCAITDPFRGGVVILDAKARGYLPSSVAAQVEGYDFCVAACELGDPADHLLVLQLCEDGSYREVWIDDDLTPAERHENFLAGLRVYRQSAVWKKQIKAAL